jgi:hypothetical protein
VNAEAGEHDAVSGGKNWHDFGGSHIRVELEIDPWPTIKIARDVRPFPYGAEAVAHGRNVGLLPAQINWRPDGLCPMAQGSKQGLAKLGAQQRRREVAGIGNDFLRGTLRWEPEA